MSYRTALGIVLFVGGLGGLVAFSLWANVLVELPRPMTDAQRVWHALTTRPLWVPASLICLAIGYSLLDAHAKPLDRSRTDH